MEVAILDWKRIDSRFVRDELYEHINAPKWVDFSAPDDDPVDDEAWFCRPNCNHPKTFEDFYNEKQRTPLSNPKHQRSASASDIPLFGDGNKRDATLKKRGINQPSVLSNKDTKYHRIPEDGENQDPNFTTPPNHKAKVKKEVIKSSMEKEQTKHTIMRKEQAPKLKSTLSAKNLFSGGDLLNKVAEFCNELKKMATRAKDKEIAESVIRDDVGKQETQDHLDENSGDLHERKPLLELSKEKGEVKQISIPKGQQRRKKRNDDAENTPISVDVKDIKQQEAEGLLPIRTSPPTPQCFSAGHGPHKATTPSPFRPRPQERGRGILQEVKPINREEKAKHRGGEVADKEAKSLDVFWFLKPCTLSS